MLNRRVGQLPLFDTSGDYAAFEHILQAAHAQTRVRIAVYCLTPTHWHLLLWPRTDGQLSEVLRWITVVHAQHWQGRIAIRLGYESLLRPRGRPQGS